jgi:beta-lactamase regulating signal transducer with metallopeptidase domain
MNPWVQHLILNALGLGLLGVLAWVVPHSWRHEPRATHRFFVLIVLLSVSIPALQFSLWACFPPQAGELTEATSRPGFRSPPRYLTSDVAVKRVLGSARHGEPETEVSLRRWEAAGEATVSVFDLKRDRPSESTGQFLLTAYIVGAGSVAVYQTIRLLRTINFLARCRPVTDPQILELWQAVAGGSELCDRLRLLRSDEIHCPCCWGLLRPRLVLPADGRACNLDALRWSFRHELVHLERGDSWIVLWQSLFLTLYWYHPAAWWLSRGLNWWREASCDQVVVQRAGKRKSYALALVSFAESPVPTVLGRQVTFMHSVGTLYCLRDRLELLVRDDQRASGWRRGLTWAAAHAALALITIGELAADGPVSAQFAPAPTLANRGDRSADKGGDRGGIRRSERITEIQIQDRP